MKRGVIRGQCCVAVESRESRDGGREAQKSNTPVQLSSACPESYLLQLENPIRSNFGGLTSRAMNRPDWLFYHLPGNVHRRCELARVSHKPTRRRFRFHLRAVMVLALVKCEGKRHHARGTTTHNPMKKYAIQNALGKSSALLGGKYVAIRVTPTRRVNTSQRTLSQS